MTFVTVCSGDAIYNEGNVKQGGIQPMNKKNEPSLKGTFVSVLLLAAFILVSWLGVFFLFLDRN